MADPEITYEYLPDEDGVVYQEIPTTPEERRKTRISLYDANKRQARKQQIQQDIAQAQASEQEARRAEEIYSGRRYAMMGVPEALQPVLGYTEAGARDFLTGVGEGAKSLLIDLPNWISGGKLQKESEAVGKWLSEQSVAEKALTGQESLTVKALSGVGKGIGSSIPSMAVGGGVGTGLAKGASLLTAKTAAKVAAQVLGQTAAESLTEGASSYSDIYKSVKDSGADDETADRLASEGARNVAAANAALLAFTNSLGPTMKIAKGLVRDKAINQVAKQVGLPRRAAKFIYEVAKDAVMEGQVEERFQEGIQQAAKKSASERSFEDFYKKAIAEGIDSEEAAQAAAVGSLIGPLMSLGGSLATRGETRASAPDVLVGDVVDTTGPQAPALSWTPEAERRLPTAAETQLRTNFAAPTAEGVQPSVINERTVGVTPLGTTTSGPLAPSEIITSPTLEQQQQERDLVSFAEEVERFREQEALPKLDTEGEFLGRQREAESVAATARNLTQSSAALQAIEELPDAESFALDKGLQDFVNSLPGVSAKIAEREAARISGLIEQAQDELAAVRQDKPTGKTGANIKEWQKRVAAAEKKLNNALKGKETKDAAQARKLKQDSVGQRVQTGEGGISPETGGSDLTVQGGEGQTQGQEVISGILGQIDADVQTVLERFNQTARSLTPSILRGEAKGASKQDVTTAKQARVDLSQAAAMRDAALKRLQKQAVAVEPKQAAEMFAKTREAIKRNASGLQANANGFVEIAIALIQDLAAMGQRGVQAFVEQMRQLLDRQQIAQIEARYGSLEGLYEQALTASQREVTTSEGQKVTLTEPDLLAEAQAATNEASFAIEELRNREMTSAARRDAIASVKAELQRKMDAIATKVGQDISTRQPASVAPVATETTGDVFGQKLEYLNSGFNFLQVLDAAIKAAGGTTIGERLGIDWNTATLQDYAKALSSAINGLGKTAQETALKLSKKFRDLSMADRLRMAQLAHDFAKFDDLKARAPKDKVQSAALAGTKASRFEGIENITKNFQDMVISAEGDPELQKKLRAWGMKAIESAKNPKNWPAFVRSKVLHPNIRSLLNPRALVVKSHLDSYVDTVGRMRSMFHDLSADMDKLYRASKPNDPTYGQKQNTILGTVLAVGSMLDNGNGKVLTKEELKRLAPDMGQETIDLYYKIRNRVDGVTKELLKSLDVENKNQIARLEQKKTELLSQLAQATDDRSKEGIQKNLNDLEKTREEWEEAYKSSSANYKNKAYWPLNRYGKYRFDIYDKSGSRYAMLLSEKSGKAGVDDVIQQIVATSQYNKSLRDKILSGEIQPDGIKAVDMAKAEQELGGVEFDAPTLRLLTASKNIDGYLGVQLELAIASAFSDDFAKAHQQNRKGIPGFSTDAQRVLESFSRVTSNLVANNLHKFQLEDARTAMLDATKDPTKYTFQEKQDAVEMERLIRETKNPSYSAAANAISSSAYFAALANVPGFALGQLAQYTGIVAPMLESFYHRKKEATPTKAAVWAISTLSPRLVKPWGLDLNTLSPQQVEALSKSVVSENDMLQFTGGDRAKAQRMAVYVRETIKHLLSTSAFMSTAKSFVSESPFGGRGTQGQVSRLWEKVREKSSLFAEKSENANRIATAAAYAILAAQAGNWSIDSTGTTFDPGATPEQVAQTARFMSDTLNYAGGRGNKAPWQILPWLRTAGMFKGFMFNTLNLLDAMGRLEKEQGRKLNENEIADYLRPQITSGIILGALGGPKAIPYLSIILALAAALMPDKPEKELEQWMMETVPFWLRRGLPNLAGVDLSAMLTMSLGTSDPKAKPSEQLVSLLGGPAYSYIKGVIDNSSTLTENVLSSPQDIDLKKSLRAIAGRGPANLVEAVQGEYADKGVIGGKEGSALSKAYQRTLRGLSLTPTDRAKMQEQRSAGFELNAVRKALVDKWQKNIKNSMNRDGEPDPATVERWANAMEEFNSKYETLLEKRGVKPLKFSDVSLKSLEPYMEAAAEKAGVKR